MNVPFARFIRSYPELVETFRDRSTDLELSRLELDRIAGIPSGYAGKILSKTPVKTIGLTTLGPVLESLGLVLCVLEDPAARDRTLARRTPFDATNRRDGNHCNPKRSPPAIAAAAPTEPLLVHEEPAAKPKQDTGHAHLRVVQLRSSGTRFGGGPL